MSETDKKIVEMQSEFIKQMDEDAKKQYLAFHEGILLAKEMMGAGKKA